jgi:3-isopropylmalate/(R)-2-methylmalate dehydratase small subunit
MTEAFTQFEAIAAPLDLASVDTGQIFPSRFLRKPRTAGLHQFLFHDARYDDQKRERPDFVLNKPSYRSAQILVTGSNFGCGSSREAAVHALADAGFRCIIAPSYGEIFFLACFRNGILPIVLPERATRALMDHLQATPGARIRVDLESQFVEMPGIARFSFDISPSRKARLKRGLDDCALALEKIDEIRAFAERYLAKVPWASPNERKS